MEESNPPLARPGEDQGESGAKCPNLKSITEYVVGTLTGEVRKAVERHIPLCDRCKSAEKSLRDSMEEGAEIGRRIDALSYDELVARVNAMVQDPNFDAVELTAIVERCERELDKNPRYDAAIGTLIKVVETPLFAGTAGYAKAGDIVHGRLALTSTKIPVVGKAPGAEK